MYFVRTQPSEIACGVLDRKHTEFQSRLAKEATTKSPREKYLKQTWNGKRSCALAVNVRVSSRPRSLHLKFCSDNKHNFPMRKAYTKSMNYCESLECFVRTSFISLMREAVECLDCSFYLVEGRGRGLRRKDGQESSTHPNALLEPTSLFTKYLAALIYHHSCAQ